MKAVEPAGWPMVMAGAAGHLLLLCAPLAMAGGRSLSPGDGRLVLFLAIMTVWCVAEAIVQPSRAVAAGGERAWLPPAIGVATLAAFWGSLLDTAPGAGAAVGAAGLAGGGAMLVGIALRVAAIRTLGCFFLDEITIVRHQALVTGGVYRQVRHPSEAGTLLLVLGGATLLGSAVGMAFATIVVLPAVLWRVRLENAVLARSYPTSYPAYARATPNLLPAPIRLLYPRGRDLARKHCQTPGPPASRDGSA